VAPRQIQIQEGGAEHLEETGIAEQPRERWPAPRTAALTHVEAGFGVKLHQAAAMGRRRPAPITQQHQGRSRNSQAMVPRPRPRAANGNDGGRLRALECFDMEAIVRGSSVVTSHATAKTAGKCSGACSATTPFAAPQQEIVEHVSLADRPWC